MKTWKVRVKGRFERIIIFYVLLFLAINVAFLGASHGRASLLTLFNGGSADDVALLLVTAPFWIPFIIITLKRLFTSKIPKEINVDPARGNIKIRYSHKNFDIIPLEDLALSFAPNGSQWQISITFNKKFIGTRGQWVYKKVVRVIGFRYTFSWTVEQVGEITAYLNQCGVEMRKSSDEEMTLMDKIIG